MSQLSRLGAFTLLAPASTTIMVGCVIVPGLQNIAAHTGVAGHEGWLVTIPALGVVMLGPLAASVIRRTGAWKALCLGLLAYGALGVCGQFLHGMVVLLGSRLLLGGATAVIMAAGTGLISEFYDGPARLRMIALQGMAIELGGVIFLFVGGILAAIDWRRPFLLYTVAWIFMAMVLLFVPRPPARKAIEAAAPSVVRLSSSLKFVYSAALFSMMLFFIAVIKLPAKLADLQLNEAQTGYFLSFISLVAVVTAGFLPRVVACTGDRTTLCISFLCYACAHAVFMTAASVWLLCVGAIVLGVGFGLSIPLVNNMTIDASTVTQRPHTLSYLSMAIFSGQFLSSLAEYIPSASAHLFNVAAGIGALCSFVTYAVQPRSATRKQS